MAIFNFPVNPLVGQTYTGPNSVVYTWDGEKWVGSAIGTGGSGSSLVSDPIAGTEQYIVPGQVGDTPLTIRGLNGQAAPLLDLQDYLGNTLSAFDNTGWLGIGVVDPQEALDVDGNIALTGGLSANGSFGTPGQHLVTDGVTAYWADQFAGGIDGILSGGNVTGQSLTVGDMVVDGDLTVNGTMTTIDTEVIRLADNIITLNSNYTGNTPNENAGIEVNRGSLQPKRLYWDEISDVWTTGTDTFRAGLIQGNLVGNVTGQVSSIANHTTDGLGEGLNNLYFTQARARGAITATGDLTYNAATGVIHYDESVSTVNGFTGDVVLTTDEVPEGATNQYLNSASWSTYIGGTSLNDLGDVDVAGVQNGDILYWNSTTGKWSTIAGDFFDNFIILADFDINTGILSHTRNDGNVIPVSLDGRYLQLSGGTLTGPLYGTEAFFSNVDVTDTLTAYGVEVTDNLHVAGNAQVDGNFDAANADIGELNAFNATFGTAAVNGGLTANTIVAANVDVTDTLTANIGSFDSVDVAAGLTANTIVAANVDVTDTLTANMATIADGVVTGNLDVQGTLTATNVDISIDQLNDVNAAGAANADVLYWNAGGNGGLGAWETIAGNAFDTYVSAAAFDGATGDLTLTRNDGNTVVESLDGRYAQAVNGVVPDATGNILINIAATSTGDTASFPTAPTEGEVFIISGDADANNDGETYIYVAGGWQRIVSFDQAEADVRYVNTNGDTMTGSLVLAADPTVPLGAVTKQYVDALAANTASISAFTFGSATDGNLVITDLIGTQWGVDLDGRYLELAAGGTVAGNTVFNGTLQSTTTPAGANDVVNKAYADALVANSEVTINAVSFGTATDGNLQIQETNGSMWGVDLDGRYLELAGGTVTGPVTFQGDVTANAVTAANVDVTDTLTADTAAINGNLTANTSTFANTNVTDTMTAETAVVNGGLTANTISAANVNVTDTMTADTAAINGNLTANTSTFANTNVTDTMTAQNADVTGNLTANTISAANVDVSDTMTAETAVVNGGLTANTISAANVDVSDTMTAKDVVMSGNVTISGTLTANNVDVSLSQINDVDTTGVANGDILYWDATAGEWTTIAGDFGDDYVNTVGFSTANGDLTLTRTDGNTMVQNLDGRYLELAGGTLTGPVTFQGDVTANVISAANVTVSDTLTAANANVTDTLTADTAVVNGGLTANTISAANVDVSDTMTAETAVVNGNLTANTSTFANTNITNTLTTDTAVVNGGLTANTISAANANVTDTLTANDVVMSGNVTISGTLTAANVDIALDELKGINVGAAANGDVLYYNSTAGEWQPKVDVHVSNAVFTTTTGNVTITMTDASTYEMDLDGRYPTTVNGIVPDAGGNIAVSLTATQTGQLSARPATANDGLLYVVSGDANTTLNGDTYIWVGNNTVGTWEEIAPSDVAGNDARYVNVSGDTMQGQFTLDSGQTFASDDDAASVGYVKDYVANVSIGDFADANTAGVSNGQILYWDQTEGAWKAKAEVVDTKVASVAFNNTDGNLVITDTASATFAVDLDGRYVVGPNGTTTGEVLTWNGTAWVATAPAAAAFDWQSGAGAPATTTKADNTTALTEGDMFWDTTNNKLYAYDVGGSAWVAVDTDDDTTVASVAFTIADGNLVITDSASATFAVDLDGRYLVEPTAGANGQVVTWNNVTSAWEAQTPVSGVTTLAALTDANTAGVTDGQVLTWDNTNSVWAPTTPITFDNYIASATVASNNTSFSVDLVNANTSVANVSVDLTHGITNHSDVDTLTITPIANSSLLGWDGTNWVPVVSLDASSGAANDF